MVRVTMGPAFAAVEPNYILEEALTWIPEPGHFREYALLEGETRVLTPAMRDKYECFQGTVGQGPDGSLTFTVEGLSTPAS